MPSRVIDVHGVPVHGPTVDDETRCVHWHGPLDVVAIRFRCCDRFFPCADCHTAVADHAPEVWPVDERDQDAVLCGVCGQLLTVDAYEGVDACPACAAPFNPGCRLHSHLYFAPVD